MQRLILHIDFDSFFASVEQQYRPEFQGKPLGVTAQNGRNAVIAASKEAKKLGVKGGSSRFEALKLCPTMEFVPADFTKYWKISQKFIAICKSYSHLIEVFSIDELFLDVTMTAHLFGGVYPLIKHLKKRVREEIGECITVSVGISYNKLLAKLGSGLKKPDGIVEIKESQLPYIFKIATLTDICGIGPRIAARLQQMGIFTLTQLSVVPLSSLIAEFGNVEGTFLYNVGKGIDTREVVTYTAVEDAKSISRNYCLPVNEYNTRVILQNIYELCEELGIKLRRLHKKARHAGISLRGTDNFAFGKTYQYYFNTGRDIFDAVMTYIHKNCHPREHEAFDRISCYIDSIASLQNDNLHYVRQISVWVSYLSNEETTTIHMFQDSPRQENLIRTIDQLNDKFGNHTIRNAFLTYADKLTTVPNGFMADRYERMKLAQSR